MRVNHSTLHYKIRGRSKLFTALVKLGSIEDIKEFSGICETADFDVTLTSGHYTVNAKTLMGIFSLDLSVPAEVRAECAAGDKFIEKIRKYITP